MDLTEIPVYGKQENSAYNDQLESTRHHPLLLFNQEDECSAAKLRRGNVHSVESRKGFLYQAQSWKTARRVVAKVEHHRGELFPR